MRTRENFIAFKTIVTREVKRFMRIWVQTLIPPAITITLYFVIFGSLIGSRIGTMDGIPYMSFIVPGLVMMSVITNSYLNTVSSFFGTKFQKSIEEMLVSPIPNWIILLGFVVGGMCRGLLIGVIVTIVSLFFTHIHIHSVLITLGIVLMSSLLFSLAGFTNGIYARKFDDISIIPTFVITPLTYLGGVFYSIHLLPEFWTKVSMANPILYMVNAFRYGILGISDIQIGSAILIIFAFTVGLFVFNLYLLKRGIGIRT